MNAPKRALHPVCSASLLVLVALSLLGASYRQDARGSIEGAAVDENGAVIPGVTVTLQCDCKECPRTSCSQCCPEDFRKTATTGSDGRFRISDIPPGVYVISGEAEGFAKTTVRGVTVRTNAEETITLTFKSGGDTRPRVEDKSRRSSSASNAAATQETTEPRAQASPSPTPGGASLTTVQGTVVNKSNDKVVAGATVLFFACDCYSECTNHVCSESCCPVAATATSDENGKFTVLVPARGYKTRTLFGAYTVDEQVMVKPKPNQKVQLNLAIF